MNKHKRNAKIATSLNEVVAQTKLSGNEFSVKIIARGADGKKGTGDDKIRRKSRTKVKGDSMGEGFKVGDKVKIKTSGLTRQTEKGFKRYLGKSGKIVKDYGDGDMKVNLGGNNDISINSKDLVKEDMSTSSDVDMNPTGKPKKKKKCETFSVSDNCFHKFRHGKTKFERWSKYLDLTDESQKKIYDWAKKHHNGTIILKNSTTGQVRGIRYNRTGGGKWGTITRLKEQVLETNKKFTVK